MAAHRYWRVYITAANGHAAVTCVEIELRTSFGGSNVATGGTASASTTSFGWVASNAFNGSYSAPGWHSSALLDGTPQWIEYDFGAGNDKDIVEFKWFSRPDDVNVAAAQSPKDFKLQYSDDNSTWFDHVSITGSTNWMLGESRICPAPTNDVSTAQWWRLLMTANNGGDDYGISKLDLRTTVGGSNVATGGTAYAATTSSTNVPSRAFDANDSTSYVSSGITNPQWLLYKFADGSPQNIVEVLIRNRSDDTAVSAAQSPKDFKLQYKSAGAHDVWTDVFLVTSSTGWAAPEARVFPATDGANTSNFLLFM